MLLISIRFKPYYFHYTSSLTLQSNLFLEMSAKRLRGWCLQKEIQTVNPCAKGESASGSKTQSQLGNKLLSLWAHGTLSAIVVQQLAHLAILDGAAHPELYTIAKMGNFGAHQGNVHRDLMKEFADSTCIHGHKLLTTYVDPKSSSQEEGNADIILPHVLFSSLAKGYPRDLKNFFALRAWSISGTKLLKQRMKEYIITLAS